MGRELKKELKLGGCIDHNCGAKESKSTNRVCVDFKSRGRIYLVKKCIILMLMLAMIFLGTLSFAITPTNRFSDINANHWAISFIDYLKSSNIVAGYPDGTFRPQSNVKINEFIAMTVKALGFYYEAPAADWAQPYIDKALELKIIVPEQFKNYNDFINRQSMTSVTVNAATLNEDRPSTEYDRYVANEIKDYATVCNNIKQNILDAYKMGIATGYSDKTFRPLLSSTRAEATTLISKIINPDIRDVPNYDFKTTIKHWYWVKADGERVIAETNIKRTGEFKLVDDDYYMPVYKGINVTEIYELAKYMNTLSVEAGDGPFYMFTKGNNGFSLDAYVNKSTYTSIFQQTNQQHDHIIEMINRTELIIGAYAYKYPEFTYMISLDKVYYEKHNNFIEKMIQFQFKEDASIVIEKINFAMATNEQELIKFSVNGRNVQINNTNNHIKIEYSVKYN